MVSIKKDAHIAGIARPFPALIKSRGSNFMVTRIAEEIDKHAKPLGLTPAEYLAKKWFAASSSTVTPEAVR